MLMEKKDFILIYKNEGELLSELLERARVENNIDQNEPITYAGRLDPMAEGMVLLLVGEEVHQKEKYLGLDKEYEVDILLGVSTDTGDALGVIRKDREVLDEFENFGDMLKEFVGKFEQTYPWFSSRRVEGKPLFEHAKLGNVVNRPTKNVEIKSIELFARDFLTKDELADLAISRVSQVKGDFRQSEIIKSWETFKLRASEESRFPVFSIRVVCSSGTFMRVLAEKVGEKLALPAFAWKIKRSQILGLD